MIQNYKKDFYNKKALPKKINTTEGKVARTLAIDSSEEDDASNLEKTVEIKAPRAPWKLQNTQKLKAMMAKLKKDITVIMNYREKRNEAICEHRIFIRLDLLNTYIEQVLYIKDSVKKGGAIFLESLFAMKKKTDDTLNKIREDVFRAYLDLETEDKYNIARQGGQMACIFTLLGIIERELHSSYEKISLAIKKRNEYRQKNNKAVTELFSSFRSLPAIKPSKQKSKERLTYVPKKINVKKFMEDLLPENIPPDNRKTCGGFERLDRQQKHQGISITNSIEMENSALRNSINSCLHHLEDKLKNNYSTVLKSPDNILYDDCSSHAEIGQLEYKATGFEISISDESIQIKIPTNVIYLVRNSNYKSNVKSELGENLVQKDNAHASIKCSTANSSCSVTDFQIENTASEESLSSNYTDIITDSEIGMEFVKGNHFKNKLLYNNKKKINNYKKCIPFFSENGYWYPISKENEVPKNNDPSETKTDEGTLTEEKSIFSLWKENSNFASKYGSKICELSNPLFGNVLQLVDIIKKIYCDCNGRNSFYPQENFEMLSNMHEAKSLTSTVLQCCNDCPPSISQSSLESPSLWKESASRLCELCPGCISLTKLSNDFV